MKPYKHEFTIDENKKVISFAGVDFKEFYMLDRATDVKSLMGFYNTSDKGVNWARLFSDRYEITPAKFVKVHNALMMKVWIEPIKEHVNRFAYNNRKKLIPHKIKSIWKQLGNIEQAKKDDIYNIVPWIIQEGKNPKQLKENFGKSLWKKICKQSMTRNKYLAAGAYRQTNTSIETAIVLPSYILKRGGESTFQWTDSTKWAIENKLINSADLSSKSRSSVNIQIAIRASRLYEDTKRMAKDLGKGFSPSWNQHKMKEKHEEYVKLINLKRYSPVPYECLKGFEFKEIEHKGYLATLLNSAALIHEEGQSMHHCVGAYASYVAEGNYLVYSVTLDGKRSSTIAFRRWDHNDEWTFNQHYGYCNAHVTNKYEKEFKEIILNKLNKRK